MPGGRNQSCIVSTGVPGFRGPDIVAGVYDPLLVALSIVTAVIASFVALDMATRVVAASGSPVRSALWLACGALAMGTGIWAMHFVGMLAFSLPIALAYDVPITLASLAVAALSSALALHTIARPSLGRRRLLIAGTLMGLGIACMHYLGMEAMRMQPRIRYDPALFALSVVLAVAASTAALLICFRLRHETIVTGPWKKSASAVVMGAAIVGMHYTGMAAANFAKGGVCGALADGMGGAWLGFVIAGLATLFLLTTLLSSIYEATPPTIRSRLVFLVIAAVMPVAVMTLALVLLNFERVRDVKAGDRLNTARAIAAAVDRDLSGIESGLRVLAASQLPPGDALAAFSLEAREAMPLLHASGLRLEDSAGNLVMDIRQPRHGSTVVAGPSGASSPAMAPRPGSAPTAPMAPALPGEPSQEQLIEVSVPLPADKAAQLQGAATLRARLVPDRLSDLLALQQMDRDWLATVYDRDGRVVARTQGAERYFGVEAPRDLLLKLRGQWEGLMDTTSLDGVAVQTAFVRTETSGWAVAISVPSASLRLPLTRALAWVVGGFLLTIAGSLLLAWRIGGRIAGAVQALTQPALALGTGVAVEVPPLGVVEVDRVGRALTHAARLLDAAQHEANHDALTGLANRSLFRQMVQQQLALARRNGTSLAVLYVDLDGFKEVNDTHGHGVGDLLLKEAAQRLRTAVRAGDLVARLGGDEFAVALVQPGQRGAAKVAAKLVQWLSEPFELGGLRVSVSASIGGASAPSSPAGEPADCEALLEQADAAMYQAKQSGKSRFVLAEA